MKKIDNNNILYKKKIIDVNIIATMSAGKSTLINSLLGKKILPTHAGACTAIVTKIEDNKNDIFRAIVLDKNNEEIVRYSNINYEDMKYLNNSNKVSEVDIKGNISFINCENITLVLIDTPGPDSDIDERYDEITNKALDNS